MIVIRRRKIPIEMLLRSLGTRGVDLAVVETLALAGIAQQVIGTSDLLELLFRIRSRVFVWMILYTRPT